MASAPPMVPGATSQRCAASVALCALLLLGCFGGPAAVTASAAADSTAVSPYLLGLDFPVSMAFAADGRLFYNEKFSGQIRVVDTTGPSPQVIPLPFALVPFVNNSTEMGLLGIALDPAWATTPWLYVYHTFDNGTVQENRISRFWAANDTAGASETIVTGIPAWPYHNGGVIQFGPDGKLYATTGDANNGALSPDTAYLGGKVLRFEKDGSIPADNPLAGSPVYSRGHRNVFGLTFEPRTGRPIITENGELTNDEVNAIKPGENYGWPWDAGFANNSSVVDPIWAISPTIAPTGIVADLSRHGSDNLTDILFGDWNTGSLRRLTLGPPGFDRALEEALVFTRGVSHILDLDFGPGGLLYISTPAGIYTSDLRVVGNQPPVPVIWTNRSIAFVGSAVSFYGSGSFDPEGGGIYAHLWDFGDGTSTNGSYASHAFGAAGNYTVRLTVADEIRASNSTSLVFTVLRQDQNKPPVAVIAPSRPIQFVNRPVGFGSSESYDPEDGGLYSFAWRFGDGRNDTGSYVWHNFSSSGTYTVTLTTLDEFEAAGFASVAVRILNPSENTPPTAVASVAARGWAGRPMNFSSSRSFDAEGGIGGHVWQFGDGSSSALGVAEHTYASTGTYTGALTVTDELGAQDSTSFTVEILDPASNQPPTAVIAPLPGLLKAGVPLGFSGAASSDAEGGIYRHEWAFGDGQFGNGSYLTHVFAEAGEYLVDLTVYDELGASASASVTLRVRPSAIPPAVTFVSNHWTTNLGEPLYFDGSESFDEDGYITDAYWTFQDGGVEHGLQVTHYFRTAGDHEVTLTVVDDTGLAANASSMVHVTVPPPATASPLAGVITLVAASAIVGAAAFRRR